MMKQKIIIKINEKNKQKLEMHFQNNFLSFFLFVEIIE